MTRGASGKLLFAVIAMSESYLRLNAKLGQKGGNDVDTGQVRTILVAPSAVQMR
jgi:hypothetical protein